MYLDMKLNKINVKLPVPQVGSKKYNYFLDKNRITFIDDQPYNQKIDYIINDDSLLLFGKGHFKLNEKKDSLLMAGEIIINKKGKITYINNNSGHYQPTEEEFKSFFNELKDNYQELLIKKFKYEIFYFENQCKVF